jgi:phosphoribosylformylglycinamidine synthase subunit PurQ / glutaminase
MATPRILVLRAPGTNCDVETAYAFEQAGGRVSRPHVNALLEQKDQLEDHQILCLPGGFSYGDDIASGRVLGNQLRLRLANVLFDFRDRGGLVLGICNGFQVLMKTGLLDVDDAEGPQASLTWNDSGHYEARWVQLTATPGKCIFLADQQVMELPVAHAEGKFVVRDQAVLRRLSDEGRLVLRYRNGVGSDESLSSPQDATIEYPANPNGAQGNVAGLCDGTGRVLGLMPHPERYISSQQHPQWTRRQPLQDHGDGMAVFENAVKYFK